MIEPDFQDRIVAALLKADKRAHIATAIEVDLFDPDLQDTVRLLREIYSHQSAPSRVQIDQFFTVRRVTVPDRLRKIRGRLTDIDLALLADLRADLKVRARLLEVQELLDEGKVQKAADMMGLSTSIKAETIELGKGKATSVLRVGQCTTGFKKLDVDFHGGLAAGELGVILGKTGSGKSAFLAHIACANVRMGRNVLYLSAEINTGIIHDRCSSNLTGMPTPVGKAKQIKRHRRLVGVLNKCGGSLLGRYAVAGTMRIRTAVGENTPDLLIVDAPECFADDGQEQDYRLRKQAIIDEILTVAGTLRCPVWISWHNKREAYQRHAEADDAAETLSSMRAATAVLSIYRPSEHTVELLCVKNRIGPERLLVECNANYELCRFDATNSRRHYSEQEE